MTYPRSNCIYETPTNMCKITDKPCHSPDYMSKAKPPKCHTEDEYSIFRRPEERCKFRGKTIECTKPNCQRVCIDYLYCGGLPNCFEPVENADESVLALKRLQFINIQDV